MAQTGSLSSTSQSSVLRSRAWWAVVVRFLIHGLIISTWVSRIPALKTSLRLSDGSLGLALLGTAVGSLLAIPICGWLIAKIGSKRATAWTSAGLCLALVLPAFAVNTATLFAALAVLGSMAGANDVAMNAQAVTVERFLGTPTMSRFHAMFSVGGIIGAAAGGVVASRGIQPRMHFTVVAFAIFAVAVCTWSWMLDSESTCDVEPDISAPGAGLSLRAVPAGLLMLSGIGFCILLSEGAIADWAAVYLKEVLGADPGTAAAGYAVFSASMAVFRLAGDAITVRFGPLWTVRGGGMVAACGLTSALIVHSPGWALPGFALVGAGFSSIIPLVFAAAGRLRSVGEGAGVATVSGLGYLGFLAGPPCIGLLSQATSLRIGLSLVVVLSLTAALLARAVQRAD